MKTENYKLIKDTYESINTHFLKNWNILNTKDTRDMVKSLLKHKLKEIIDGVICDETNNTSDIIENQILKAKIYTNLPSGDIKYIDFTFGNVDVDWNNFVKFKIYEK